MYYFDIHSHNIREKYSIFNCHTNVLPDGICSVGVHPWYIDEGEIDEQMIAMRKAAEQRQVLAIGEVGLDKLIKTPLSVQIKVFREQIEWAEQLEKPLIIHCVKAWAELVNVYKEKPRNAPWIVHGFRGKPQLAVQLLALGLKLSFGRYFNEDAARKAFPSSLFVETDNELDIKHVYSSLATALDISVSELDKQIINNVYYTFNIDEQYLLQQF